MMYVERKIVKMIAMMFVYLGVPLVCFMFAVENQALWFANIFFDKLYVFQLVPMFILGLAKLNEGVNICTIVRYKSRIECLKEQIFIQYIYAFIYLTIWFTMVVIFSLIKFKSITEIDTFCVLDWYVRYLLGFAIIVNISGIFNKSSNKIVSNLSYICVYIILVLEVVGIVPEINANFSFNIYVIFSWLFLEDIRSYIAILLIWIISTCYLFKVSARKDIF